MLIFKEVFAQSRSSSGGGGESTGRLKNAKTVGGQVNRDNASAGGRLKKAKTVETGTVKRNNYKRVFQMGSK